MTALAISAESRRKPSTISASRCAMVSPNPEAVDAVTGHYNPRNAGAGYGEGFRGRPDQVLTDLGRVPSPVPPPERPGEGQEADAGQAPVRQQVRRRFRPAQARPQTEG